MNSLLSRRLGVSAFTLVEVLVSVAVLAILLLAVSQMLSVTGIMIKNSGGHLDADGQARLVFDRLAGDFAGIPKRPDIDFNFLSQAGNDKFFFYSEAPAFLSSTAPSSLQNTASLIGYQINTSYQLERLGYGLNWDRSGNSLTQFAFPNSATSFAPTAMSTINDGNSGEWSTVIGNDGAKGNYHVLGDMVFRLEFCFLLKDGTYSIQPVLSTTPSTWPSAPLFYTSQSGAPTPNNDTTQKYAVGSRWWDSTNSRGYICLQATTGAAVWRPLGWDDVAGIVIALALLDDGSRTVLTASGKTLSQAALQLQDVKASDLSASPPQLMASTWQTTVTSSSFATAAGLPEQVAAQVRIYQRCLYLDNLNNL